MAEHDKEVFRLRMEEGLSRRQIAEKMRLTEKMVKSALERENKKSQKVSVVDTTNININEEVYRQMERGITREDLQNKYSLSPRTLSAILDDIQDEGILFDEIGGELKLRRLVLTADENKHTAPWEGNRVIRFGLCGDKQFNSNYTQITHMHTLYDIYEREGISTVYDLGDLDEGEQMRQGHQYECYNQGADAHKAEIVKNHPYRKGIKTYFITGNHDHSLIKLAGFDIGAAVAKEREDMKYLGPEFAMVDLTPNCVLELRHPTDGSCYAWSYKIQKMIEAMPGGEKPNILAVGHYHKMEQIFYRNVHAIQTGCLQAQTSFMRGRSLVAMMGGWIIEIEVDKKGEITRIKSEFFPFYYAIKDDWKKYQK